MLTSTSVFFNRLQLPGGHSNYSSPAASLERCTLLLSDTINLTSLQDIYKRKRISMWVAFVICLITIPVFYYYDNRQISEAKLLTIDSLTLSQNPDYTGGKHPGINIYLTNTDKTLVVNLEELNCVNKNEVLNNFKTDDTISIKIFSSDKDGFYNAGSINKFQKIYGLNKSGREFIELNCRNSVSTRKTIAAIYASIATAILSFVLAVFVFRPKNKFAKKGIIYRDPITVICFCWFIILILALLISRQSSAQHSFLLQQGAKNISSSAVLLSAAYLPVVRQVRLAEHK